MAFEQAAFFRDQAAAVRTAGEEQKIVDFKSELRDYISLVSDGSRTVFSVFQMRGGQLCGRDLYRSSGSGPSEDLMESFIVQYYSSASVFPEEIFSSVKINSILIESYFEKEKKCPVKIMEPEGRSLKLLSLAEENAKMELARWKNTVSMEEFSLSLKKELGLQKAPKIIEGFDIAHLAGKNTVAAMVRFSGGIPDKAGYRHYHIKSLKGKIDDYKAIREAVGRRYSRLLNENARLPDLILIDGGIGQLNSAAAVLKALGLEELQIFGLAKKNEEISCTDGTIINLEKGSPALRLLQQVRDEAHRFSTAFSKKLRSADTEFTVLKNIKGLGPARSEKLMKKYAAAAEIISAGEEELAAFLKISRTSAEEIINQLKKISKN
jgi:excinuclease ABC subunit C